MPKKPTTKKVKSPAKVRKPTVPKRAPLNLKDLVGRQSPEDTKARVGKLIREHREKIGASQKTLAHDAGVSQSLVARIEDGDRVPSRSQLRSFAHTLGLSPYQRKYLLRLAMYSECEYPDLIILSLDEVIEQADLQLPYFGEYSRVEHAPDHSIESLLQNPARAFSEALLSFPSQALGYRETDVFVQFFANLLHCARDVTAFVDTHEAADQIKNVFFDSKGKPNSAYWNVPVNRIFDDVKWIVSPPNFVRPTSLLVLKRALMSAEFTIIPFNSKPFYAFTPISKNAVQAVLDSSSKILESIVEQLGAKNAVKTEMGIFRRYVLMR